MRVKRQRIFREIGTGAASGQQYVERYHPQRPMSLESEFAVPMLVGVGIGVFFAPLATLFVAHITSSIAWWVVLPIAFLAIAGLTFWHKHNAASETCWDVEHIPLEPEPEPAPVTERAIVVSAPNVRDFNEPAEPEPGPVEEPDVVDQELEDFQLFIQMAAVSTAARRMNRRFGRKRANAMRQALIDAGLAAWNGEPNSTAGWRLLHDEEVVQASLCRIELPGST